MSKALKKPRQSRRDFDSRFEPLLDFDQAAAMLRIHPKALQRMARLGEVHGINIGKLWRFRASDLEGWINSKRA